MTGKHGGELGDAKEGAEHHWLHQAKWLAIRKSKDRCHPRLTAHGTGTRAPGRSPFPFLAPSSIIRTALGETKSVSLPLCRPQPGSQGLVNGKHQYLMAPVGCFALKVKESRPLRHIPACQKPVPSPRKAPPLLTRSCRLPRPCGWGAARGLGWGAGPPAWPPASPPCPMGMGHEVAVPGWGGGPGKALQHQPLVANSFA